MSSQAFFYVNLGLGLFLILIFLFGKKGIVAPSKLNLRKGGGPGKNLAKAETRSPESHSFEAQEKCLNVLFMYNGHHFDAYEVLGVPAGANFQMVERYYKEALSRQGQDRDFIEAAFFAIKSTLPK